MFDPLRELLIKHIAAVGYADLPAFLIRGEYHQQGLAELPFMLMGRAPGLYRQSLELGVRKIDSGYAQGAIWSNAQQILPTVGRLAASTGKSALFAAAIIDSRLGLVGPQTTVAGALRFAAGYGVATAAGCSHPQSLA